MPNPLSAKEFGKLTPDQFSHFVKRLPEVRGQMQELPHFLRQNERRVNELLGPGNVFWGSIYERPFLEQMALLFVQIGLHIPLHEAVQTEDPQQVVLSWANEHSPLDVWYDAHEHQIEWKHLLWLAIVLQRNILAIMLYHQSMGGLVEAVRQGDDPALFKAVRIDRTVLLAPTCADRWSKAEMLNDKCFLRHLRSAFKGPSKKHMEAIQDLRYSIVALRECGFDRFNDADLEQLFIRTRLYPNSPGALKSLRKHIQEARKITTT